MNISSHIKTHNLSRETICEQAGISRAMLSLVESGKRQIGPNKVNDLAAALGIDPSELRPDWAEIVGS
ncbi:helix-turn-helix transcriptional regulator [Epibacterium ulvae]|uniref:helix-turn-helix domain-containing protein n=1 Tax=Epibacterium ulvae TaxID=1156985 RepID=UPI001BFC2171|nr:helix-turn-helix transcriptional regulator [Epibacterium ulvae]